MCERFIPASMQAIQNLVEPNFSDGLPDETSDVKPKGKSLILLNGENCEMEVVEAEFSLYPDWANQPLSYASHLASFERIKSLKTFKRAFRKSQFCLVPMQAFYMPLPPDDESCDGYSSNVAWATIHRQENDLFTVPAIYEYNDNFEQPMYSFALLTTDASRKALMSGFHMPITENQCIMVIPPAHREHFLVSNWKFIGRYLTDIDSEFYVCT